VTLYYTPLDPIPSTRLKAKSLKMLASQIISDYNQIKASGGTEWRF
jgi:hypothetical protein